MNSAATRDQRPCDNCRRRKIRCLFASDDAVRCILCVSRSTECTYIEEAPRKKRPHSSSAVSADKGQQGRPNQRSKNSHDDGSVLRDYSSLKGNTLLKETLGHQNRQSSSVIGVTSDFDPTIVQSLPFNSKGEILAIKEPFILRRPNREVHFMMRPDSQEEMEQELKNLDAVEKLVAPYGSELVNLYFRIVHPSFPILHKKVFLEKHGRSYRESTPTGLGAVYIMALNWWSYSPSLSSKPKPDAKSLEKLVLQMLYDAHQRPKISDLQGGLVLFQRPDAVSWAMTGHLVAMSQNLGINLDCSDWQIPDWERGVRKRVAWAMFMQDKWGALIYGRPSNISVEDWDVQQLELSDFPETSKDDDDEEGSAEIDKGRQTFVQMVSLTQIVADIIDQFFTLKAVRRREDLPNVLQRAKPIQLKLKDWYRNLPASLSVDETKPRRLSSVGYLHLAYYTAEISLHRAILRSHELPNPDADLLLLTRQVAGTRFTSALDFVKRLKQEHLQSFWYFSSNISLAIIGIFAGVLAVTSLDQQERESYISMLAEYRWILRISSTGAEFMKYAVGLLDTNSQLLEQQTDAINSTTSQQTTDALYSPRYDEISPTFSDSGTSAGRADWMGKDGFDTQQLDFDTELSTLSRYDINGFFEFDTTGL